MKMKNWIKKNQFRSDRESNKLRRKKSLKEIMEINISELKITQSTSYHIERPKKHLTRGMKELQQNMSLKIHTSGWV